MKIRIMKYLPLLAAVVLCSCDSWLDIEPKGKIILTTAEEYAQLFDDAYSNSYNLSDVAYLDDELWVNTQVLVNGWNAMNLTVANILYNPDYDRSENAIGNAGNGVTMFQQGYEHITKICNTIIYQKDNIKGTETEIKHLVAQAKMFRAFTYFTLINLYAKPYDATTAEKDGGVPLRTDPFIETKPNPAKSTVAQIYAQIEKDIKEAIGDLPETARTPFRFNQAAGYAFKAKVHLFKKEWDDCIEAALESYELTHATYDLAGLVDPATNKPSSPIYATGEENLYFQTTKTTYFLIHQDLIDLYDAGLGAYGQGADVTDARRDLYRRPAATIKDYMFTLQYIPAPKEYSANSIGLRTTEVMLMLAECYARKGENDKVKEYLKPYFESRYRNYDHAALTIPSNVTDAVKMVLNERRKELTMGYNRFLDLKRLNTEAAYRTVPSRTIPGDPSVTPGIPQATYTLPADSPLYILPFPAKVLANDPRLESNTW